MAKTEELTGTVSLDLTREPALDADSASILSKVQALVISDQASYENAGRILQQSVQAVAKVEAFWEEDKTLAHRLHKSICDKITKFAAPWRSVREILEPKMVAYKRAESRKREEEEQRIRKEAERKVREAEAAAAELKRKADAEAEALRQQGEIAKAREIAQRATAKAEEVVAVAEMLADSSAVMPSAPKVAGLGESQPWVGVVDDPMELIKAVADGRVHLMQDVKKRGGGFESVPIITINPAVVTYIAKRMGRNNIGLPGCHGERDFGLRVAKSSPVRERAAVGDALQDWSGKDDEGW